MGIECVRGVITEEAVSCAKRIVFHSTRRMLFQANLYSFDSEFGRQMKRAIEKITVKGRGRLSYRNLLRFMGTDKDELKRVLETLIARGDIAVEKGKCGGDVFILQR